MGVLLPRRSLRRGDNKNGIFRRRDAAHISVMRTTVVAADMGVVLWSHLNPQSRPTTADEEGSKQALPKRRAHPKKQQRPRTTKTISHKSLPFLVETFLPTFQRTSALKIVVQNASGPDRIAPLLRYSRMRVCRFAQCLRLLTAVGTHICNFANETRLSR